MSVKTSINIPDDIFNEAKKISDNFALLLLKRLKST